MNDHPTADAPVTQHLDGAIITCTVNNTKLRFFVSNPGDAIQSYHCRGAFFEPDELDIISRHVQPGSVCVDVGANVGNHALFIDKFLSPREIILFEVNPEAIDILTINHLLNRCRSWNMDYIGYALADQFGKMTKQFSPKDNLGATQFASSPVGEFRCITGDSVMASIPVGFIKIDVEGTEMAVLSGFSETISRWRPVIFVELGTYNLATFTAWLDRHSYRIAEKFERYAGLPNYLIKPV
jgi:FkbM family methyltransferase